MIILLQIIAGIILIPLTLIVLLVFNIFIRHWVWRLGVVLFGLVYAGFVALMFTSLAAGFWTILLFIALYLFRISRMALRLREKEGGKAYPIVKGDINIRQPAFRIAFVFPLAFLNVAKYTPDALNRKMSRESGLEIDMRKLIPHLLVSGKGTEVSINADEADIYFEIQ